MAAARGIAAVSVIDFRHRARRICVFFVRFADCGSASDFGYVQYFIHRYERVAPVENWQPYRVRCVIFSGKNLGHNIVRGEKGQDRRTEWLRVWK